MGGQAPAGKRISAEPSPDPPENAAEVSRTGAGKSGMLCLASHQQKKMCQSQLSKTDRATVQHRQAFLDSLETGGKFTSQIAPSGMAVGDQRAAPATPQAPLLTSSAATSVPEPSPSRPAADTAARVCARGSKDSSVTSTSSSSASPLAATGENEVTKPRPVSQKLGAVMSCGETTLSVSSETDSLAQEPLQAETTAVPSEFAMPSCARDADPVPNLRSNPVKVQGGTLPTKPSRCGKLALSTQAALDEKRAAEFAMRELVPSSAQVIAAQDAEYQESLLNDRLKDLLQEHEDLSCLVISMRADLEAATKLRENASLRMSRYGDNPKLQAEVERAQKIEDEARKPVSSMQERIDTIEGEALEIHEMLSAAESIRMG